MCDVACCCARRPSTSTRSEDEGAPPQWMRRCSQGVDVQLAEAFSIVLLAPPAAAAHRRGVLFRTPPSASSHVVQDGAVSVPGVLCAARRPAWCTAMGTRVKALLPARRARHARAAGGAYAGAAWRRMTRTLGLRVGRARSAGSANRNSPPAERPRSTSEAASRTARDGGA
ncbi:hypothetical protein FA09DRAFT_104173 [Tilletiopsis washingtonensis]|uniref:Uncharacterized protein n=1 Tax=Tilletiopsis washingtonensis TaxID=58919 RepID=A0A316Z514_9BASI|nr:hypothetical protein FA09DRAFT_104173 [Tilletiopsis washingtonensis]PWN96032.1 hypothetical protein FA09DRAFT_104173 [Tilletiopsis washingtonensis]